MAPLKKYFMGLETPPRKRAASCQKCIRTPDIERVGKTSRHGTFFEMLGNFSFGDYFKREAAPWAWEFITRELKLPADRIWVSVFYEDDEAYDIWTKEVGVSPDRMVRLGREDNFWEIGAGPCGPCSELYFDRGEEYGCGEEGCAPGCDCDRYVEFWNLVFTQFNSDGQGNYTPLEHPNIDTGMGLERLACVMQGVDNLFEVDTVRKIMQHVASLAGVTYGENERSDVALRVVTDHIRSTVFLVGDGVAPSNERRGYVLRRLLRRAARFGKLLGIKKPFLYNVCDTVIEENRVAYPELYENASYIREVIRQEEERFDRTINQGMDMLSAILGSHETKTGKIVSGEDAFKLYDTFGFPLDLTREIAKDAGFEIDEESFLAQMREQRKRARDARLSQGGLGWEEDVLAGEEFEEVFVGYDSLSAKTQILYIIKEGAMAQEAEEGDKATVILETTPFYAESGGQAGDRGRITTDSGGVFLVEDTKKSPTGHILHIGTQLTGVIKAGEGGKAAVDQGLRRATMRNHTAAHLLQAALREALGDHVHQAGQLVNEEGCRFDFTHFAAPDQETVKRVEDSVNGMILDALGVTVTEKPVEEAKREGALALFGDKYSDIVRVCEIGEGRSAELCGGTHVKNTAEIGLFKILRESSVAAGVRRIEAVTGEGVLSFLAERESFLQAACEPLKISSPAELPARVAALSAQLKASQRQLDEQSKKLARLETGDLTRDALEIGPIKFLTAILSLEGVDALKATADELKALSPDIAGILALPDKADPLKGKATLLAFAGKNAVAAGVNAGKLVQEAARRAGGSGGGRPDNAMGGAGEPEKLEEALRAAADIVKLQLGI
jgi:alanyl-tRNA synthetase